MRRALLLLTLTSALHGAEVSAYCHCARCNGKAGQPTASGRMPVDGISIAAPRRVPLGTWVRLQGPGIDMVRRVDDRLSPRFDHRWDLFTNSHSGALRWGVKKLKITVLPGPPKRRAINP